MNFTIRPLASVTIASPDGPEMPTDPLVTAPSSVVMEYRIVVLAGQVSGEAMPPLIHCNPAP